MTTPASEQDVLAVISLAARLPESERVELGRDFPEFDLPALLEQASRAGAAPDATPAAPARGPAIHLRELQFKLQLASRALTRVTPECERTWLALGARLSNAAKVDFAAALVGALGSGGAAGSIYQEAWKPALVGGIVACLASILTLIGQFQRRALQADTSLSATYAFLSESRGLLLQLNDEISLWLQQPEDVLAVNDEPISSVATRAVELCAKVDAAMALAYPLLGHRGV